MQATTSNGFADVKGIVAVDEHVPAAGAIVWWRLSGRVDYEVLKSAWIEAGLAEKDLLHPCTNATALRRAANDLREKRRLVRPLGRGEGFAIVREKVVKDKHELEHEVLCKVLLDPAGRPQFEHFGDREEEGYKIADEVRTAFEAHLSEVECEDFSGWLVKLMPKLDAVGLRDTGGVYFVPESAVALLGRVAQVLSNVTGHVINRVPAMRGADAVAAILDAVEAEATQEAERMERDIEAGKLGERGFENRLAYCDEVEGKVTRYEELLGAKLDTFRARLENLRANLSLAAMKANGTRVTDA